MSFESEFMDKQSEIISLFSEVVSDDTEEMYLFVYYGQMQMMTHDFFKVRGKRVGGNDAGISDDDEDRITDAVVDEIMPELEEICHKYQKPMPAEFRYIYNFKSGSFDAKYKQESDLGEDYECGEEAMAWGDSLFE